MKTLGLVGGTGWVSTVDYYRLINQLTNKKLGGHHSAKLILYSLNFADIVAFNRVDDTESIYGMIKNACAKLTDAGADGVVLCANTLHKFADRLQREVDKPIIHIAAAVSTEVARANLSRVGLIGTKHTMEGDFYTAKFSSAGISIITPDESDRDLVNSIIYNELLLEDYREESKTALLGVIGRLASMGADGIILGCTELPLVIEDNDCELPLFNTLTIHCHAAVAFALGM